MTSLSLVVALAVVCGWTSGALARAASTENPSEADTKEILGMGTYWRWQAEMRRPLVRRAGSDRLEPVRFRTVKRMFLQGFRETPPAPTGWQQPDFDDSAWPRSYTINIANVACRLVEDFAVRLRGKFRVTDAAAVRSPNLALTYRGGVVVYLNGREVARGDVPEGQLAPGQQAASYPLECWVDGEGDPINQRGGHIRNKADLPRVARRTRTLTVQVPTDALRQGVNVLALEFRRAPYHSTVYAWDTLRFMERHPNWTTLDIQQVHLSAAGGGIEPNVARPTGVQVWVQDRNDRVTPADYGDPSEPVNTVKIVAVRNGSFCGQVVVGSDRPIKAIKIAASALKSADGNEIAADHVAFLYGVDVGGVKGKRWQDGLSPHPPTEVPVSDSSDYRWNEWHAIGQGATLPILVRVHVPRAAKAGDYRGTLTVQVSDGTFALPVELHVADWTAPDPKQFRTYIGIYESPTSLALEYNVPMWSEEHWNLIDRSLALLARAGSKMVNVMVVDRTQFGNDEGWITWIRKPGGGYEYDFSAFDRYMKLAVKHFGTLDYVALQVWHSGGWKARPADQENTVTVLDPRTGKREHVQVPAFGTAQSRAFFEPVLAEAHRRLKALGQEKAMCLGILSDGTGPPEVFKAFDEIWPGEGKAGWTRGLHSPCRWNRPQVLSGKGNMLVVLWEHCYGMRLPDPWDPPPDIWNLRGRPGTAYVRIGGHRSRVSLVGYRTMAARSLLMGKQGVGRICLDFWPVIKDRGGRRRWVYNRWPRSSCAQRAPALQFLAWPAPDGPRTTLRFEALCEGIQETEALIVLSEAVHRHADRIGTDLAGRCADLLKRTLWYCHTRPVVMHTGPVHMNHLGWQDLSRRIFDTAAEVSKRIEDRWVEPIAQRDVGRHP